MTYSPAGMDALPVGFPDTLSKPIGPFADVTSTKSQAAHQSQSLRDFRICASPLHISPVLLAKRQYHPVNTEYSQTVGDGSVIDGQMLITGLSTS